MLDQRHNLFLHISDLTGNFMLIGLQVKESLSGEEVERLSGVTRKYVGWIGFLALRKHRFPRCMRGICEYRTP